MYRAFLTLCLSIFLSLSVSAQNLGGGLILGFNASQIDGDGAQGFSKFGFQAGGFVNYAFSRLFRLQPELVYEQLGSADKDLGLIARMNYISLPVLANFAVQVDLGSSTEEIQFLIGPVIGTFIGGVDGDGVEIQWVNRIDLRAVAGIELNVGRWGLGIRYGYSMAPIAGEGNSNPILQPGSRGLYHNYANFSLRYHLAEPSFP